MPDPALPPSMSAEIKQLSDRIERLERSSRMPPLLVDSWSSQEGDRIQTSSPTGTPTGRKVVLSPAYEVLTAEGHIATDADTIGKVSIRENYSLTDTAVCQVPANSVGLVRFTWLHPFKVGWEGQPIDLIWYVGKVSGTGYVWAYRPWLLTFGGSSYLDGAADGKPEFIGESLPPPPPPPPKPPPTVRTTQFNPTAYGGWRPQGGWYKPSPYQGTSSTGQWGPYTGIACYNAAAIRADISGRTVTGAALYVSRLDGIGVHGPQPLYVGWHAYTAIPGGQPAVGGMRHVGSLSVNQAAWLPLGVDLIEAIRAGQNGLGCYGNAYMGTIGWQLQVTSRG